MGEVHYEVFARKLAGAPWTLSGAMEDREGADQLASQLLSSGKAAGVKVIRETFNPSTGSFTSSTVSRQGDAEDTKPSVRAPERARPAATKPSEPRDPRQPRAAARRPDDWLTRLKRSLLGQ